MVREFHRVNKDESREQILAAEGRLPDGVIACVGGGSNAIGIFHPFVQDKGVRLVGVSRYALIWVITRRVLKAVRWAYSRAWRVMCYRMRMVSSRHAFSECGLRLCVYWA